MNTGRRGARHVPAPLARHSWFSVGAAAGALLLIAGGVVALTLGGHGAPTRPVAADCGLVNCGAVPVVPVTSASAQNQVTGPPHHPRASASPAATKRPAPTPSPSAAQSGTPAPVPARSTARATEPPPPPAAPDVTVTYTPDQQQHFGSSQDQPQFRGPQGFQGQLTIVNHGTSQVAGWTVQLTLPGDEVDFVGNQAGWGGSPFDHWQFSGDTLTLSADSSEALGPGAVLNVTIHGQGRAAVPSGCTFDGTACRS